MDATPSQMTNRRPFITTRRLLGVGLGLALGLGLLLPYMMLSDQPMFTEAWVRQKITALGSFGPVALVAIMALAIVVSPIPSGPVGVAAGAIYGTLLGGLLTVTGAFLGACIAFLAARYLGFDAIRKSENRVLRAIAAPRSQWSLMAIVFASRLIPFISFDAVSYAAGLTSLTFPRFAAATLLGVIPVSFVLTAIGAGLQDAEMSTPLLAVLGGVTLVPVVGKWLWDRLRQASQPPK
jgi:uncharacterized membrane protein YdjX (TVP38/TMEM64 family)